MTFILKDRVKETSTTNGTGTLTLSGAVTGFQAFTAIGNGNTTYYGIYNGDTQWEVGIGTVGSGTLSRDTVLSSSNAGSLVSFTRTLTVWCDYPADKASYFDVNGNLVINGSDTQVQYNSNGSLAGNSNFTYTGTDLNIPFGTSNSATSSAKIALALSMIA